MGAAKVKKANGKYPASPKFEPDYKLPKLEVLNSEQLKPKSIRGLPLLACNHVGESRKNPDSDFFGYILRIEHEGVKGVFKVCEADAHKMVKATVARIPYALLSQKSMTKVMLSKDETVLATSKRGRELSKQVQKAESLFQQLDDAVSHMTENGMTVEDVTAVVATDDEKIPFAFTPSESPDRVSSLVSALTLTGARFVGGIFQATQKGEQINLALAVSKPTKKNMNDQVALHKYLTKAA